MKRFLFLALVAVVFTACQDGSSPTQTVFETASSAINDGSQSGNVDVFFLPPLVENPSGDPNFGDRDANANLGPVAKICLLDDRAMCDSDVDVGPNLPMVFTNGQFYAVRWQTRLFDLTSGDEYRIRIFLGEAELASRDVRPLDRLGRGGFTCAGAFSSFVNSGTGPASPSGSVSKARRHAFLITPDFSATTRIGPASRQPSLQVKHSNWEIPEAQRLMGRALSPWSPARLCAIVTVSQPARSIFRRSALASRSRR